MIEKQPAKQLTVYKASAGSGKTFTLAVEYIKLLIDNPRSYENILAVTFTNKATEEMKTRILSQLYGISHHLSDSQGYLEKICQEMKLEEEFVAKRAAEALNLLLHNYNFFRVQTIDTFFQGIMRNLARELSLSNNLRITLNDDQIIGQAVDSLMENLTSEKELMRWVEEYVNDNMDEERNWNVADDIKLFGKNLSKEFYKTNRNRLAAAFDDPDFFITYKRQLTEIITNIEKKYRKKGNEALEIMKKNGLSADDFFQGAKGIAGYFSKLSKGTFYNTKTPILNSYTQKAIDSVDGWIKAKAKNDDFVRSVVEAELYPLLLDIENHRSKDVLMFNSAKITLKNINKLRLLHSIEEEVKRENGEHSRFMLSSTQSLLHEMLEGDSNVVPFIYEKIGSKITHIMIDEFQDTSRIQWKNFKVLLDEAMSNPVFTEDDERTISNNLVVGDVKQSIYRFRSGDWRLLNNIEGEFAPSATRIQPLKTNYRSECNIVAFNNIFFQVAAKIEADRIAPPSDETPEYKKEWAEQLRNAYSDVTQEVPANKESLGWVKIKLFPGKKDDTEEEILDYVYKHISLLLQEGARMSDIAILVRKNMDIPLLAEYLSGRDTSLRMVSEEAFRLEASPAVNIIVNAMKLLSNHKDIQAKATLTELYLKHISCDAPTQAKGKEYLAEIDKAYAKLPTEFTDETKQYELSSYALNELVEHLFRIFNIGKIEGQAIYISTFLDKLNTYVKDNTAILDKFLDVWDEDLHDCTVSVGNIDGIRILSMHKSKGLEFDHVIIPYCNWKLESSKGNTLWCETQKEPFCQLSFIPIDYTNENTLKDSIYEYQGNEESMLNMVDNLNLLYVAFTRAGKSLTVVGDLKVSSKNGEDAGYRATLIAKTLRKISEDGLLEGVSFVDIENEEPAEFNFGAIYCKEKTEKKSDNIFLTKPENIVLSMESHENSAVQFRQSNESRDFSEDFTDENDKKRFIRNGTILHQLFSKIRNINDIKSIISDMEFSGVLYNEDMTAEKLQEEITERLSSPQVKDWFDPRWKVYNECCILHKGEDGKVIEDRPDRVITDGETTIVIDYKFGKPHNTYEEQVRRYIERLQQIGHNNVKGYLWYVISNKVVNVSL